MAAMLAMASGVTVSCAPRRDRTGGWRLSATANRLGYGTWSGSTPTAYDRPETVGPGD
jgi:hypothetical protein